MEYTKEQIRDLWATNKLIQTPDGDYRMHKMSYGDYFAEPASYRGGERDGFHSKTIWFKYDGDKKKYITL